MPRTYVWLVWASVSLLPWSILYWRRPALRPVMLWSSVFALPFGFSEILFAGDYWRPPTLFGLAERVHLDLESFVFLFAAGGLAAAAYHVATGRPVVVGRRARNPQHRVRYQLALAAPVLVF